MRAALKGYEYAVENTREVADKCNVAIAFGERHLPGFTAPDGMDNLNILKSFPKKGLRRKCQMPMMPRVSG